MLYQVRTWIGGIIILLGVIHTCFIFPVGNFEADNLWFLGSGIAIILSGVMNIVAVVNCRQRWLSILILSVNVVMLGLFILARQAVEGPQVYVGILLYLVEVVLVVVQTRFGKKEADEYIHYSKPTNNEFKEVLSDTEVVPMLRIFDEQKAKEFYIDWLGFTLEWEHRFEESLPVYMEITKAGMKLHLTEHHGDCSPGGKVFIVCAGLREYHAQLLEKKYAYNRPGLGRASWGSLEMTVIDPFGNQLMFTEKDTEG